MADAEALDSASTADRSTVQRLGAHVDDAHALELDTAKQPVLAVGSQLVHGSVGLNAAERVYVDEGVNAIRVPTILLSVMPHYASVHHVKIEGSWISDTLADLTAIGAVDAIEVVTAGYFVSVDQAEALAAWYSSWRGPRRPVFVLDPTLGDVEVGFYTDPALASAIREHLVPVATGLTPNLFELAHLTGYDLAEFDSFDTVERAARSLMGAHTRWIVVTGLDLDPSGASATAEHTQTGPERQIGEMVVTSDGTRIHRHEKLPTAAKGVGDTFTAALITWLLRGVDLDVAVDRAAAEVRRRVR